MFNGMDIYNWLWASRFMTYVKSLASYMAAILMHVVSGTAPNIVTRRPLEGVCGWYNFQHNIYEFIKFC